MKIIVLHINSSNPEQDGMETGVPVDHINTVESIQADDKVTWVTCVTWTNHFFQGKVFVKESVSEVAAKANERGSVHVW